MDEGNIEKVRELLKEVLSSVNTWLHFAEAKNAALIAFNVAIISLIISSNQLHDSVILFTGICVCLLISTVLSLLSFKPVFNAVSCKKTHEENLLFYAYIASLEPKEYIRLVRLTYFPNNELTDEEDPLCIDYAKEIIVNSQISVRKLKMFNISLYLDILSLTLTVVGLICA